MFTLKKTTAIGRRGELETPHGTVQTPFFMPVATGGAMKGITHEDLITLGAEILLANTYHLHLQPGENIVAEAGGLHRFIGWDRPILTDSGGFQVFSLRKISSIGDDGVHFQSPLNGDRLFLDPRSAMEIQHTLGADIILCFDHCPPSTAKRSEIMSAVDRTLRWAGECKRWHCELKRPKSPKRPTRPRNHSSDSSDSSVSSDSPLLFAVIQGGLERDLREKCAEELIAMGFDGYAIGGLAVGESEEEMFSVVETICPMLPEEKLRYLMGVGRIEQLKKAIALGIDMFDCVLPMREARHGTLILSDGSKIRIDAAAFTNDHTVIDAASPSPLSRKHLKSYLHHLFRSHERLAETIACMQNVGVTLDFLRNLRTKIEE